MTTEDRIGERSEAYRRFQQKLRDVEDDLAALRGARERMSELGTAYRTEIEDLGEEKSEAVSEDGLATVSCDGTGKVRRVRLAEEHYRNVDERQLSHAVLQARDRARSAALPGPSR